MTPYLCTQHENQLMNLLEFTCVWRPLSLNLAFVISQELMGIHHGISKKDEPDKRIFEVYRKFFLSE